MSDPTLEKLANEVHEVWSHWMRYMFSKGDINPDGSWTMPQWAANRWSRQMTTPYAELEESEKQSDRDVLREHQPTVLKLKAQVRELEEEEKQRLLDRELQLQKELKKTGDKLTNIRHRRDEFRRKADNFQIDSHDNIELKAQVRELEEAFMTLVEGRDFYDIMQLTGITERQAKDIEAFAERVLDKNVKQWSERNKRKEKGE